MDKTTKAVAIKVYDTDGNVRQEIEGRMTGENLLEVLEEIISEEGIPVVRDLELPGVKTCQCHKEAGERLMETIRQVMDTLKPKDGMQRPTMALEYKTPEVTFAAAGEAEDVMESSMDVLEAVYGDDAGYFIVKGEGVPKPLYQG